MQSAIILPLQHSSNHHGFTLGKHHGYIPYYGYANTYFEHISKLLALTVCIVPGRVRTDQKLNTEGGLTCGRRAF